MRGILLGIAAGLVAGTLSTLAYTHYLGEGSQLNQAQADLASAQASITKTAQDSQQLKSETDALSDQVQHLTSANDALKHQVEALKSASTAAAPAPNPGGMADMMKVGIAMQQQQRLLALKARLHLTPEQEAAVKAAMDVEAKRTEKMFQGGKIDPQAMMGANNSKSVDQTLNDILTPDQKTAYDQMKADEKNSQAETMASVEMNQMAPLLQLSDTQKDQVYSALAQVQIDMQDPAWIKNNPPDPSNPASILDARAQTVENALAKILTPDQLATYHQQAQSQLQMQKAMMQKFAPPGGTVITK